MPFEEFFGHLMTSMTNDVIGMDKSIVPTRSAKFTRNMLTAFTIVFEVGKIHQEHVDSIHHCFQVTICQDNSQKKKA